MARTYSQNNYALPQASIDGKVYDISYGVNQRIQLSPPTIIGLSSGDTTITISFTDPNNYPPGTIASYAIYANGKLWGYGNATGAGTKSIIATGLTNGVSYYIRIAAMSYNNVNLIDYKGSERSNALIAIPQYQLPATRTNINLNTTNTSFIDVIREPIGILSTSSLIATSTYTNQGSPTEYNAYEFSPRFNLATYDGIVKVKARVVFGGKDSTYPGEVDYVFKNAIVNLNPAFSILANEESKTLRNIYDEGSASLNPVPLTLSLEMDQALNSLFYNEYYLSKTFLEKNIQESIKSNFLNILRSRDAARKFVDILNFREVGLAPKWKEFDLPYKGTVWINTKLLIASSETNRFNYSLVDSNGKILKTGRNAGVLLLSDIQDSSSFAFGVLRSVSSDEDLYGSIEA
jgi:hypothetical protein